MGLRPSAQKQFPKTIKVHDSQPRSVRERHPGSKAAAEGPQGRIPKLEANLETKTHRVLCDRNMI